MPIEVPAPNLNGYKKRSLSPAEIDEAMRNYQKIHVEIFFKTPKPPKGTKTNKNSVRQEESSPFFLMDDDESSSTK
jgi:hypothetical protein